MEFSKYQKLNNTYKQETIDKIIYEGLDKESSWTVTEKIHGANFSFWCDGNIVKVANRSGFVDGSFYKCQSVINNYTESMFSLFRHIWDKGDILTLYGELYGGGIQKGISYGSDRDFAFFEMRVNGVPLNQEYHIYPSMVGFNEVPVIKFNTTFERALEVDNEFKSLLTPKDHEGDNFAEGVVIAPTKPLWFRNGKRVCLKNKTVKFSEKKNTKHKSKPTTLCGHDKRLLDDVLVYCTENRVNNVLSKIGEVTNKDFGKIMGLTVQDAIEDWESDNNGNIRECMEDPKKFMKTLQFEFSSTVRSVFVKVIE